MILPEIDEEGYRRTAVKSRHRSQVVMRADEQEDLGYLTKIIEAGGKFHLYMKKKTDDK